MEKNLWDNLKAIFVTYRIRFFKALVTVIVANILLIFTPLVFRQALLAIFPSTGTSMSRMTEMSILLLDGYYSSLWVWVGVLLLFAVSAAYFKYLMRVAFISISRDAERTVRSKLFFRIQNQSMAFYDKHGIGELLSRLTNDISAYRDLLGPGIMYPLFFITLVVPGLIALFSISPLLAAISTFPMLIIPLLNLLTRQHIYKLSRDAQKGLGGLSNMVQEHYSGIRMIKGYAVESKFFFCFRELCGSLIWTNIKLNWFQGLLFPFFTFLTKSTTILLVLFTGLIILKGWSLLSAADFVSFMWIQSYTFAPVLMLAWVLPIYQRGRAAYDRLVEIYNEPVEVKDNALSQLAIPIKADIEFHHLSFKYPQTHKLVLRNFSLHIRGGTFVGITGPIGAGKTTLFRLINREYEIPRGTLSIAGRDIHDYSLEAFWKEIVTVEQMPFLFSQSVADNVRFGKEEALQTEIETVAKYADLHDTVLNFPQQYDTLIGERGVTLSGGQRQRLAMARAFLVNRSILLLDDVFSAVDSETETRMFFAIQKNFKDKTVLLITHRTSILESMDRIIYIQEGEVLEDGSPEQLKAKGGHYSALVELQKLGSQHA